MSDIAELQLLIIKEQQRGNELDEKMTNEQRLLEEAEDKKCKIIREMLQQELAALQEQNMIKDQELIEIQKRKDVYFRGSFWVGGEICSKCKFFYFYIVFSDIYKCVY